MGQRTPVQKHAGHGTKKKSALRRRGRDLRRAALWGSPHATLLFHVSRQFARACPRQIDATIDARKRISFSCAHFAIL